MFLKIVMNSEFKGNDRPRFCGCFLNLFHVTSMSFEQIIELAISQDTDKFWCFRVSDLS